MADAPEQEDRPLASYVGLMGIYTALVAAFAAWFRTSGRELPPRLETRDLALLTVATHKTARLVAKDKVMAPVRAPFTEYEGKGGPAEVLESARGTGPRRVLGELLTCPYCLDVWISTFFVVGLLTAPRLTRWTMSVLAAVFGEDVLHIAYKKACQSL